MRNVFLPSFALPVPFNERQLSLDLVEVNIEGISIRGDHARAESSLRRLDELKVTASDREPIALFNKPHRTLQGNRLEATIAKGGEAAQGRTFLPVLSGKIVAVFSKDPTAIYLESRDITEVSLRLKLNLPRFLSAQSFVRVSRTQKIFARRPFALARCDGHQVEDDEVAFGRDYNIVMGDSRVYEYALLKSPTAHLQDLIAAIAETVSGWIEDCIDPAYNRLQKTLTYSLSSIEWYAEFSAHDPRRTVARLGPVLTRQGKKANVVRRRLTGQVKQFGPHSHGMQIELAVGKKMTTYSKTSRRVRFEEKFRRNSLYRIFGRRTCLSSDEFYKALEKTRLKAVKDLTSIFAALNRQVEEFSDEKTRDDLCLTIGAFTESLGCAEEIQRSLRQSGRVTAENGSILRPSIDRLIEVGVLHYVRHAVYTVTDEYEMALRDMMNQPGAEQAMRGSQD
jgi:hypothetical protein